MKSTQGAGVQITAVLWPACECGQPYTAHIAGMCAQYRPVRPIANLGTRAYRPPPGWSWWRRTFAAGLWVIEARVQAWREAL